MKVYLMQAEHYEVPGIIIKVCATREKAVAEAMVCVNIMQQDKGRPLVSTEQEMAAAVELLADEYGEAHCYYDISEYEVL
ncbi:hypothetical protein [Bradyrhizobium sp. Tv2a-2]|uniref:hypothetical protein n=1 Tax=Bradyrhizobium sp. Tv2a-2 TaxID=113395 RepID=UPI000403B246|nr:hypothetical protein [Bradyrhizobium sp. Tv2a-2]